MGNTQTIKKIETAIGDILIIERNGSETKIVITTDQLGNLASHVIWVEGYDLE